MNFIKNIFEMFLNNLLGLIVGAVTTLIAAHYLPSLFGKDINTVVRILVLTILFLIIFILYLMITRLGNQYTFHISERTITINYCRNYVKVTNDYVCHSRKLLPVISMFSRITWYSNEKYNYNSLTHGYDIQQIGKYGDESHYNITFPEKKWFFQTIVFSTEFHGKNTLCQFKNFYWEDIVCPTDKLTIIINIPSEVCQNTLELKSFLNHENASGNKKEIIKDFSGHYVWRVKPKTGWSYKAEWQWSESEKKRIENRNNKK